MTRPLVLTFALALIVAVGVAEGRWAGRWGTTEAVGQAVARLAKLPLVIGDWQGKDEPIDPRAAAVGQLAGAVRRTYTHRTSGAEVTTLVVCGRPGPISVHTPDVCFQGAGHRMTAAPSRHRVGGGEFFVSRFEQGGEVVAAPFAVLWAWSADGAWQAPDNARLHFARQAALYKLYVVRATDPTEAKPAEHPDLTAFIRDFLPAARDALFHGS